VPTGSHIFRHSLATNLLRAGAGWSPLGPSCATARPRPPPSTPRSICRCS
jgi:hypothetical protein